MKDSINLLVIGAPFGYTGGQLRNQRSIKAYADNNMKVNLLIPYSGIKTLKGNVLEHIKKSMIHIKM